MNALPGPFRFERALLGAHRIHGLVHDRFGRLRRSFSGMMLGSVEAGRFVLREELRYDDGAVELRTWTLAPDGSSGYRGTTSDSDGPVVGEIVGREIILRYALRLALFGKPRRVTFDDRMYLEPDGTILDRAVLRLWGIEIATVTAVILPAEGTGSLRQDAARQGEIAAVG
jgi:hypothetical protein